MTTDTHEHAQVGHHDNASGPELWEWGPVTAN